MSRYKCDCGFILSNSEVPNEIEFHVYSDKEWSKVLENDSINTWEIPSPNRSVWKCPKCQRIYIFSETGELLYKYVLAT